jgi:rhodanese-related sulfurtransferase
MSWLWAFGETPEFSAADVHAFLQSLAGLGALGEEHPMARFRSLVIVDVRTEGEFQEGRVAVPAGVLLVNESVLPPWSLRARLEERKLPNEKDVCVLCICLSAHRSVMAVKLLREMGISESYQLKGGMQAWRQANLPERHHKADAEEK